MLTFNFLGYRDPDGTLHPPNNPPEWMKERVRVAVINLIENRKRIKKRVDSAAEYRATINAE